MKKAVYLTKGKGDMITAGKYTEGIYALPVYRSDNVLCKAAANICWKLHLPYTALFLGDWAWKIQDYDIIICEGLKRREWVFRYILPRKKASSRLIMWHWNKIFEHETDPNSDLAQKCEQWSFDPDDCETYHMRANTQYFATISVPFGAEKKWDLYFLGTDKGRVPLLEKLDMECRNRGLEPYFYVVGEHGMSPSEELPYRTPISYKTNIQNVSCTAAVVDIPLKGQRGLTLRVLEALYLRRKLITFNSNVKELPFYNENNILICTDNFSIDDIYEFLKIPYQDTEACVQARQYYSFPEWMKRFDLEL